MNSYKCFYRSADKLTIDEGFRETGCLRVKVSLGSGDGVLFLPQEEVQRLRDRLSQLLNERSS